MELLDIREFFKEFKCEALTSSEKNKTDIQRFSSKIRNNSLESYLKNDAWQDDLDGATKVYLIRDKEDRIVLFFSLRCGIVFTTNALDDRYNSLSEAEKMVVQMLIDALKEKNSDLYQEYVKGVQEAFPHNFAELLQIAERRRYIKNEKLEVGDTDDVLNVDECWPAIELQHFCKCDDYQIDPQIRFPVGFGLFWEKIVPVIQDISGKVGCEYLYLFAADRSDDPETKALISYYKDALCFFELEDWGVKLLKPSYDDNCRGLLQKTKYLPETREEAWESFSDHAN